mmetsp:Transcript_45698/g.120779  ORF Transcript_45698/g.120779 Transcript_45698/m.120779 type:complete len:405 (-) Transcript_45698:31-1245(-)
MFAESFNKLKKRATEIVKDAVRDDRDRKDEKEEDFFAGGGDVGGSLDGSLFVRYDVQNGSEADQDGAMFILPSSGAEPNVAHVRKHFPLTGRFHFRFKMPSLDGYDGWFWVDIPNDNGAVPVYGGQVLMKALKLPDDAAPLRAFQAMPGSVLSGGSLGGLSFSAPPRRAAPSAGLGGGLGGGLDGFDMPQERRPQAAAQPSPPVYHSPAATPPRAPSPPATPGPADDLMPMDFGGGGGAPAARAAPARPAEVAAPPPAPAPPPVVLDRAILVAEREAKEKASLEEHTKRMKEEQNKEEKMKKDKVNLSFKVAEEMNKWAKMPDGTSFKDIRTLISTVQTVIWADSGWEPVSLSELIAKDSNIKKYYRKAIIACHPDRHQEAGPEQQVRADRIFQALNEAFKAQS